jgi:antitoxin component YwqK of YwqJK toxin-antitoxin module
MITRTLLALFLLTAGWSIAQELNQTDAQGRKQGQWVVYYEKSKVPQYEGQFKDGKPFGKFVYYYPSKKIKAVMTFDTDGKTSRSMMYDETGYLMAFGKFVNKEKDSVWTHFTPMQTVSYTETYQLGQLHGQKTIYHLPATEGDKSKRIAQLYHYNKGILQGEVKEFFPDGTLKMEGTYENDKLHGVVNKYHPNGRLFIKERYKNGKKHGWWFGYDENGKETGKRYFYEGKELKDKELQRKLAELKAKGISPNE